MYKNLDKVFRKYSVSPKWRYVACEENNCCSKTSVIKFYWIIVILPEISGKNNNNWSKLHAYINIIGYYNPSARILDLVFHTTYVVCVNDMHKWRGLQLNVDLERQCFDKLFHGNFIYSQSFYNKSAEKTSPKQYFYYFVLMSGLWLEHWLCV